jgi:hypothetical protein
MISRIVRSSIAVCLFCCAGAAAAAVGDTGSPSERLLAAAGAERVDCPEDVADVAPGEEPLCGRTDPKAKQARKSALAFLESENERNRERPWIRKAPWRYRHVLVGVLPYRVAFDVSRDLMAVTPEPLCFGEDFPRAGVFRAGDPGVKPPKLVHDVRPDFPERARQYKEEGTLHGWLLIDREGRVVDACTFFVLPEHMGFEEAAAEAFEQRRYEPGTVDGKAVPVVMYTWLDWHYGFR